MDTKKGTKLTDFGTARETTNETMTIGVGTYRWMPSRKIISLSLRTSIRSAWLPRAPITFHTSTLTNEKAFRYYRLHG
ncbi:hypothetical protein Ae201684P_010431 [Aphanomyces euteiches]|nr:hypothetical protein Ae201684P_010431 [Aphanomyces euteiches]